MTQRFGQGAQRGFRRKRWLFLRFVGNSAVISPQQPVEHCAQQLHGKQQRAARGAAQPAAHRADEEERPRHRANGGQACAGIRRKRALRAQCGSEPRPVRRAGEPTCQQYSAGALWQAEKAAQRCGQRGEKIEGSAALQQRGDDKKRQKRGQHRLCPEQQTVLHALHGGLREQEQ